MLDHRAVHQATSMLITWIVMCRKYIPQLERDVLYEDNDFEINSDDEADLEQSELP